jgi:hypothetical protein
MGYLFDLDSTKLGQRTTRKRLVLRQKKMIAKAVMTVVMVSEYGSSEL